MRKVIALILALALASPAIAYPVQAVWTGRAVMVQTVTYRWMWECEYMVYGRRIYLLFEGTCPSTTLVQ